jgi:GTPase SAR1 family protein
MERTDTKQAVKVVLLGNSGAGKSSLAQRFVFNTFNHYSESTIGASFFTKHMLIQNGQQELRISDEKSSDQEEEEEAQQSIKFHGELLLSFLCQPLVAVLTLNLFNFGQYGTQQDKKNIIRLRRCIIGEHVQQ